MQPPKTQLSQLNFLFLLGSLSHGFSSLITLLEAVCPMHYSSTNTDVPTNRALLNRFLGVTVAK